MSVAVSMKWVSPINSELMPVMSALYSASTVAFCVEMFTVEAVTWALVVAAMGGLLFWGRGRTCGRRLSPARVRPHTLHILFLRPNAPGKWRPLIDWCDDVGERAARTPGTPRKGRELG